MKYVNLAKNNIDMIVWRELDSKSTCIDNGAANKYLYSEENDTKYNHLNSLTPRSQL